MRKLMIATALVSTVLATPALARDGAPYVGIDAGLLRPSPLSLRLTSTAGNVENAIRIRHKLGIDGDAVFGYDFGMFRVEGELAYKYSKLSRATILRAALNEYQGNALDIQFNSFGHSRVLSGMVNALVDFGPQDSVNLSVGAGVGGAGVFAAATGAAGAAFFSAAGADFTAAPSPSAAIVPTTVLT